MIHGNFLDIRLKVKNMYPFGGNFQEGVISGLLPVFHSHQIRFLVFYSFEPTFSLRFPLLVQLFALIQFSRTFKMDIFDRFSHFFFVFRDTKVVQSIFQFSVKLGPPCIVIKMAAPSLNCAKVLFGVIFVTDAL